MFETAFSFRGRTTRLGYFLGCVALLLAGLIPVALAAVTADAARYNPIGAGPFFQRPHMSRSSASAGCWAACSSGCWLGRCPRC